MVQKDQLPTRSNAAFDQKTEAGTRNTKPQFSVLLTGDMSFGENYQAREEERGRENILLRRGYTYTIAKLVPLLTRSDLVITNLETTVTNIGHSPFAQNKGYVHWSDILETPKQLLTHNIRAASLANNHSIDFGDAGLLQTIEVLTANGISVFGAGKNLAEARKSFNYVAKLVSPEGATANICIRVFAAFAVDDKYNRQFKAYAGLAKPGTNPLLLSELVEEISLAKAQDPGCFLIAMLHWRRDYKWRSAAQVDAAQQLLRAGANLLIGHGSHMMQEIEKLAGHWVAHGLGNFVFNSPGRYGKMKVPPYSLVARLIFRIDCPDPRLFLYPLVTDNHITSYQTRFVTNDEFRDVLDILRKRTNDPEGFDREIVSGHDEFGSFIELPCKASASKDAPPAIATVQSLL